MESPLALRNRGSQGHSFHPLPSALVLCILTNLPHVFPLLVGQDCYTRIWSLHDGQLLRTIPSPDPTSKADIPSVAFSSRLGGARGAPGLLMAVRQDLYCFSYS